MTEEEKQKKITELFANAKQYSEKDEYNEAIPFLDQILEIDPKNIRALNNKGVALYILTKYHEAIEYFNQILEIDSKHISSLNNKGIALTCLKKYQEAINCYNRVLTIDPNNIDALNNKGIALSNMHKHDEAIESFDEILKIDSNNINALYNKGNTLDNLKKYQEAIDCYDRVLKIEPNNINALNNKGIALDNLKKYQEATECYNRVLEIDPENINTLYNKGNALTNLKKYQEAIDCYDKILKIEPENINTLNNKGNTLTNLKKYQEAINCYDKILKIEPNNIIALNNKGNTLTYLKKYQEAIDYYDKILKIEPNNIEALNNKGLAFDKLRQYQETIKSYNKVLKIDPNNIKTLINKGIALAKRQQYHEAIDCYDKVLEIDPDNINALFNKGIALYFLAQYQEAIDCYDKVLKIDPSNVNTLNNKGAALCELKEYTKAIDELDKILVIKNENIIGEGIIDTLFNIGLILLKQNKNIEASIFFNKILEIKESPKYFTEANKSPLYIYNIFSKAVGINEDRLKDVVKQMIAEDVLFITSTNHLKKEEDKEKYKEIYYKTIQTVSLLHVNNDLKYEQEVAHYTKRDTSYNLLLEDANQEYKKSPLWLSTIAKGNDPQEGKILFAYLGIGRDCNTDNDDYQSFIACFTFNKQSLNQFRLYGKEQNKEATGVSLVVNNNYFDNKIGIKTTFLNSSNLLVDTNTKSTKDNASLENIEGQKLSLFRCIYIDPETEQVISLGHKEEYEIYRDAKRENKDVKFEDIDINTYKESIQGKLVEVKNQLKELKEYIDDHRKELDMQIVKELLIMLRYLIKHVAFKEEQECRIFRIEQIDHPDVKTMKNAAMYIEHLPIDKDVKTIYTAPLFEDAKLYRDIIRRQNKDIDVLVCNHPFFSK